MQLFKQTLGGSILLALMTGSLLAQQPRFTSVQQNGLLTWTNGPGTNAFILQQSAALAGPWSYAPAPFDLTISTNLQTTVSVPLASPAGFYRLWQGFGPQTLHGGWMMLAQGITNVGSILLQSDGNGTITNFGAFNLQTPPGIYGVSNNATVALSIFGGKKTNQVSGQFLPPRQIVATGPSTNLFGSLLPIENVAWCAGNWSGTLSETNDLNGLSDYSVNLSVATNGSVVLSGDFSGTGWLFALAATNGAGTGFFRTTLDSSSPYNQIRITGTLTGNTLSGAFDTDSGSGPDAVTGTVTLTRQ